jgi:hypothetical protein
MKSHPSAISMPPANAAPLTAAMTGIGHSMMARIICSTMACWRRQVSSVMPLRSFRSPPEQKALPSPVTIRQAAAFSST